MGPPDGCTKGNDYLIFVSFFAFQYPERHIEMCAVDSSFGDATTALENGDGSCYHIWYLMSNLLHIWTLIPPTFHVNC